MTKYIRFIPNRNAWPTAPDNSPLVRYGIVDGDTVFETDSFWSIDRGMEYNLSDVRLLPACWPTKIVCVGRNYVDHAKELGNPVPAEPLIFMKPLSSLIASGDKIVYPALSQLVSYEGEVGVVIGRQARHVSKDDAMQYVFGYTCVNDVTARDLQKKDGQWTRGKGFDTFCAVGPYIIPREEADFPSFRVRTFVDGEKKQDGSVMEMLFDVNAVIAYVSSFMTLEPGDLIATGTPPGVGPMQPGSRVQIDIEGLGVLENHVVAQG